MHRSIVIVGFIALASCKTKASPDVAKPLDGLRLEMPCKPGSTGATCDAAVEKPTKTVTLGGDSAKTYEVVLRFRGVVEQEKYKDGKAESLWYVGGKVADGAYNVYELTTSAPAQTFYLNAGEAGIRHVWPIDYKQTIRVKGGATVTLSGDAQDGRLIANLDEHGKPVVVAGIAPAPAAYEGQFIQIDVVSVSVAD